MKTTTRVVVAALLGLLAVVLTAHANHTTKSTVMLAELLHSVADTVGLCLLFVAITCEEKGRNVVWVGKVSGGFLVAAALGALFFGISRLTAFLGGASMPVHNSFELLLVSSLTVAIVWTQIHLTSDVHHLTHGHKHGSSKASYFFGGAKVAHKVTRAELYADLLQAMFGVVMGLVAFFWESAEGVRYVDITLSIGLGIWMLWRGISAITE